MQCAAPPSPHIFLVSIQDVTSVSLLWLLTASCIRYGSTLNMKAFSLMDQKQASTLFNVRRHLGLEPGARSVSLHARRDIAFHLLIST